MVSACDPPDAHSTPPNPLVSVILPCYNRPRFLAESVASVLGQTYRRFELIVVDDGSAEPLEDLIRPLSPAIRYVRQEHAGVAAARNLGLAEADGELIAFQDSDDLWHPDKLRRQVRLLHEQPSVGVVCTSHRVIDQQGNVLGRQWKRLHSGRVTEALFQSVFVIMPSTVVRRSVVDRVGHFNTALRINSDYQYWLRASLVAPFAALDEPLVDVRRWSNRLTGAKLDGTLLRYRMLLDFYQDLGGCDAVRPQIAQRVLAKWAFRAGRALRHDGQLAPAYHMFETSLNHRFNFRAAWARLDARCRWTLRNGGKPMPVANALLT